MSSRDLQFLDNLCTSNDRSAPKQLAPQLLTRMHQLPPADQNLLNLAISGHHTFRQIAGLVGSNPGSVCRRVTLLSQRLSDPIVVALLERPLGLSEKYIHIGLQRYLFHHGIRRIASATDCTTREIRIILLYLEKWTRVSRELADDTQIKHLKLISKRRATRSIQPNAQHQKGECEWVTNP
ncbi:MAG TPA: hypothetical protein VGQ99_16585 [Tepidisphaeraceae bacterium]|jgi:hypothetical protein|nr:hypothetical protein [Tepidisphaeraceae bacterium]